MFPNSIVSTIKQSEVLPSTSVELLQSSVLRDAYMSHGTQAEETALDLFEEISGSGNDRKRNILCFMTVRLSCKAILLCSIVNVL